MILIRGDDITKLYDIKAIPVCMLLILVSISYLLHISVLIAKLQVWGAFATAIILLVLIMINGIYSKELFWIFAFFGTGLLTTIIGSENTYDYLRENFPQFAVCLLVYVYMIKNPDTLLSAIKVLDIYIYLNLISILIFPNGMYQSGLYTENWLLGYKNPQIRIILPILTLSLISTYYKKRKFDFSNYTLITCSVLTFVFNRSSTGLIGILVFVVLFILFKYNIPSWFTLKTSLLLSGFFFILIVIYNMQYLFAFIIEDFLHKDLTFTNRTIIWQRSLDFLNDKLLLGAGYMNAQEYGNIMQNEFFSHPHNYYLYIILNGGIVLAIIILFGYILADKQIMNYKNTIPSNLILFSLFVLLIIGLTESLTSTVLLYPMLVFAMMLNRLERTKNDFGLKNNRRKKWKITIRV